MSLSVAGALVELKLLDKRIKKEIDNGIFVSYKQGKDIPKGYKDEEELKRKIIASKQSVLDLIERRNKIKSAIVKSNATTTVKIANKEMTVAEAIERKNSIEYEKKLLETLKYQLGKVSIDVEALNKDAERRAESMAQTFLGNDSANKAKVDEAEKLRLSFIDSNKAELIDPIEINKFIEELEKDIDEFEAQVDLALSISNATTFLDID